MNPIRQLLAGDPFTSTLVVLVVDRYGQGQEGQPDQLIEPLHWLPATIRMELEQDFQLELPQKVVDRISLGLQLVTTDNFYQLLPDFANACNILSGDPFNPELPELPTVAECAWGLLEGMLLAPPEDLGEPLSPEIVGYLKRAIDEEGLVRAPAILQAFLGDTPVPGDFLEDPALYGAFFESAGTRTDEIDAWLKDRWYRLTEQLEQLPLTAGSAKDLLPKLRKTWKGA